MKRWIAAVILLAFGACGDPRTPQVGEEIYGVTEYFVVSTPQGEIPCITWSAPYKGGLSCDWSGR